MDQIVLDLQCVQSATFHTGMTYTNPDGSPTNLTGWTAAMEVHRVQKLLDRKFGSNEKSLLVRCTTENGRITLGGESGTIDIKIEHQVTSNFAPGEYTYDLLLVGPQSAIRLLKGSFVVDPTLTKL